MDSTRYPPVQFEYSTRARNKRFTSSPAPISLSLLLIFDNFFFFNFVSNFCVSLHWINIEIIPLDHLLQTCLELFWLRKNRLPVLAVPVHHPRNSSLHLHPELVHRILQVPARHPPLLEMTRTIPIIASRFHHRDIRSRRRTIKVKVFINSVLVRVKLTLTIFRTRS